MRPLKIDIYGDLICPWCLIGVRRLDNVLARAFADRRVDIEHHPVILMPDMPPAGMRVVDRLTARFGHVDPVAIWQRPQAEAQRSGIDLDLSRQPMLYPTLAAHTLIRLARPRGIQHRLAVALLEAYFLAARNIGDTAVLAAIAAECGFDGSERVVQSATEQAATMRLAEAVAAQGIRGVPRVVVDGVLTLEGCQDEAALDAAVRRVRVAC